MSELVNRLSHGDHPVELTIRPERDCKALRECVDRGYIHVKFTETRGGTELGIQLAKDASKLQAEWDKGTGQITLVGNVMLDYVNVQCVAQIDLASFSGTGHLVKL